MEKLQVAFLFGGKSAEHEISIITALQALEAVDSLLYNAFPVYIHPNGKWYTGDCLLDKQFYKEMNKRLGEAEEVFLLTDPSKKGLVSHDLKRLFPVDVCFLAFHGQYGEDGCIQGLLELADVPYTSSGVLASATAMNKHYCKTLAQQYGIPVLPGALVTRQELQQNCEKTIARILASPGLEKFPLFVKPCNLGSSIGIGIATDSPSLTSAIAKSLIYDQAALIEPCVTDLLEINVAVIDGQPPRASVVEIPVATGEALTYEDKYLRPGSKHGTSEGMASLTRLIDPADLPQEIKKQVQEYALRIFQGLGCSGVCRLDYLFDKKTEKLYFNELNSIPGSLSFYLWEKSSPPLFYPAIIESLIQNAIRKKANKLSVQQTIGFIAL